MVKRIIAQSDAETRAQINEILHYPKDSAGTIMTVEYVSLREQWTVKECFDRIRKTAPDKETIYVCYVTDDKRKLLGLVTVKDLLLHDYDTPVSEFMEHNVISAGTNDDKENVAQTISRYDLYALPVVDGWKTALWHHYRRRRAGRHQRGSHRRYGEDGGYHAVGRILPQPERVADFQNRIPWLLLLMISATFTGLIIKHLRSHLKPAEHPAVCLYSHADGHGRQRRKPIFRHHRAQYGSGRVAPEGHRQGDMEGLRVAVILALCLSAVCFGKLMLLDGLLFGYAYTWDICLVVSLALFATVLLSKLVGSIMPIVAKACKLDPAVVASPFITTIVDALSLIVYCQIALAILPAI